MRRRESLEPGPPHPAESAGCTELASKGNIPYVVAISHCCPPSKQPQNLGGQILSDPIPHPNTSLYYGTGGVETNYTFKIYWRRSAATNIS